MFIRSRYLMASAAVGLVLVVASCDRNPPTTPPPAPQPGPPPAAVLRVDVVAPPEIAPNETVQLTANATRSDGSVENVSAQALWRVLAGPGGPQPLPSAILEISRTGLATGRYNGGVYVWATLGGVSGSAPVMVLPKGTFRLQGYVHENNVGLENATVTVISGVGEGLTTVTTSGGQYAIYGVSGSVRIQAKKDGYVDAVQQLDVTRPMFYPFAMVANRSRSDYSGTYTLTISARPQCPPAPGPFPDTARRRTYTASVKDDQGQLEVSLSGADFIVHFGYGNRFFGSVTSYGQVRFSIGNNYYDPGEFDIAERFGDTALLVEGYVSATGTPELISGTLDGRIIVAGTPTHPFTPFGSSCPTDRFEMVRR